ncbi:MAG TPA: ABC transporter [Bacteroidales bacterium]|jgi:ATP-binding cassette subfamily F protein uup|nr:ABC transporter [Bacteroidales bacterium]
MPAILEVEGVSKSIGDLQLLKQVSFSIEEGDKTGLIAANGTGKTTLLNILAGEESHDSGAYRFLPGKKIGYLTQEPQLDASKSILEAIFDVNNPSLDLIKEYEVAVEKNNIKKIEELSVCIDNEKLWDYESRIQQLLSQLGISNFQQKINELSGGQKKRIALAAMLIDEPDFIILDEPTNHLDVHAITWLEDYLQRSKVTLLMVTHDRYFLDRVCNDIIEIDLQKIYRYKGNYSYFLRKRAERIEQQMAEVSKAENLLRKETEWMRRMPKARGTKAKYRMENFYQLKDKAAQKRNEEKVKINVGGKRLGKKILVAKHLDFFWDGDCYLKDFSYTFNPYEKIGILGANGSGKSTFLDIVTQKLTPAAGAIETGETIKFGYYRQDGLHFDEKMKVLDALTEIAETVKLSDGTIITASQFLNHFLFPPARQYDYIYKLSGGEKRRLYLCSVLMQSPNFLILDEPTNDLDIATLEVLEEYLQDFSGCVLIVSHDRYFLDELVDHVFVFNGTGMVKDYPGNYTQYIEWSEKQKKTAGKIKEGLKPKISKPQKSQNKLTYSERLEYEQLEKEIEGLTTQKSQLEDQLNSGELSNDQIIDASKQIGELLSEIELKELRWFELAEKLDE